MTAVEHNEAGSSARTTGKARVEESDPVVETAWIDEEDVLKELFVVIMGATGCGKSSFIKTVTGINVPVSDELESCTEKVASYPFHHNGILINLIDTPGFNDTHNSDVQTLQEISFYLAESYSRDKKIAGIIYLHKISENKMVHSAMQTLSMFRQLCGDDCLPNVVLTTTFWAEEGDTATFKSQTRRAEELITSDEYWGPLVKKGARAAQYHNTKRGALEIIKMFGNQHDVVLDIQRQMVDEKRVLADTAAGMSLEVELNRLRKENEAKMEALKRDHEVYLLEKDHILESATRKLLEKLEANRMREESERVGMKKTFEAMMEEQKQAHATRVTRERAEREEAATQYQLNIAKEKREREEEAQQHEDLLAQEKKARAKEVHDREKELARMRQVSAEEVRQHSERLAKEQESSSFWRNATLWMVALAVLGIGIAMLLLGPVSLPVAPTPPAASYAGNVYNTNKYEVVAAGTPWSAVIAGGLTAAGIVFAAPIVAPMLAAAWTGGSVLAAGSAAVGSTGAVATGFQVTKVVVESASDWFGNVVQGVGNVAGGKKKG